MASNNEQQDLELSEALKALMNLRQISTLKEIAKQADCALSHLSTTYRGEATMSAMIIRRICVAFELDRSDFFRMGEMRHRMNQEIASLTDGRKDGDSEDIEFAARHYLKALLSENPERARRLLAEYADLPDPE